MRRADREECDTAGLAWRQKDDGKTSEKHKLPFSFFLAWPFGSHWYTGGEGVYKRASRVSHRYKLLIGDYDYLSQRCDILCERLAEINYLPFKI